MDNDTRKARTLRVVVEIAVPLRSLGAVEDRIDRALDFGSIQGSILSAAECSRAESINAYVERVTETR